MATDTAGTLLALVADEVGAVCRSLGIQPAQLDGELADDLCSAVVAVLRDDAERFLHDGERTASAVVSERLMRLLTVVRTVSPDEPARTGEPSHPTQLTLGVLSVVEQEAEAIRVDQAQGIDTLDRIEALTSWLFDEDAAEAQEPDDHDDCDDSQLPKKNGDHRNTAVQLLALRAVATDGPVATGAAPVH